MTVFETKVISPSYTSHNPLTYIHDGDMVVVSEGHNNTTWRCCWNHYHTRA